tara:strand:- start:153 stop:842 length:690 start_codon:yes stop_codon:yes gene_type:complete
MKYTLYCYGDSIESTCHSLSNEKFKQLLKQMKIENIDDLDEVRFETDIFKKLSIDIYNPDLFHIVAPLNNSSLSCVLKNNKGEEVLRFKIQDIKRFNDLENFNLISEENYSSLESKYLKGLEIFHEEIIPEIDNQVLLTYDQDSGGIYKLGFDSDSIPKVEDFIWIEDCFSDENKEYSYISCIIFKGKEMKLIDLLDSQGASPNTQISTRKITKNNCYFKFSISDGDFS